MAILLHKLPHEFISFKIYSFLKKVEIKCNTGVYTISFLMKTKHEETNNTLTGNDSMV